MVLKYILILFSKRDSSFEGDQLSRGALGVLNGTLGLRLRQITPAGVGGEPELSVQVNVRRHWNLVVVEVEVNGSGHLVLEVGAVIVVVTGTAWCLGALK